MRWACPERANCSRAHEPPHRAPVLAHTAGPCHALPASPQQTARPGALQRHRQSTFGGTPASAVRLCHGQRRPSLSRSPPGPWSSASSSASVSASPRRRHVALATECRFAGSLSTAAVEPPCLAYKWTPRAPLSTHCSQGQVASRGGLGSAARCRAVGRRRRLVLGLPGAARGGLARS